MNQRVDAAGLEMEETNASFQNLDSPFEEFLELLFIAEDPLVHFAVFENPIGVVANRVAVSVAALHISDEALEFLKPEVLVEDGVGAEFRAPLEAFLEHLERIGDLEVSGTEEFEEDDVGPLVAAQERNAPHGGIGGGACGGGELVFEVLEGLPVGGFEMGDEIGVFFERRGAESGGLH